MAFLLNILGRSIWPVKQSVWDPSAFQEPINKFKNESRKSLVEKYENKIKKKRKKKKKCENRKQNYKMKIVVLYIFLEHYVNLSSAAQLLELHRNYILI